MSLNEKAWEKIFNKLKIEEHFKTNLRLTITAKQLNEIGKRQARILAKIDTKESLPSLFKKNELNINAITNGSYILYKDYGHRSFVKLPDFKSVQLEKYIPKFDFELDTLPYSPKFSESNAIDFANNSKLLSIISKENELKLTTRGRMRASPFKFMMGTIGEFSVNGPQIEVDAGYEGKNNFLIIEAKSSTRDSFNIRQLYYPYRHFLHKTDKKIRAILLSFSNGVYYFTEIDFHDRDYYSYEIIGTKAFEIVTGVPEKISLRDLLNQKTHTPEDIPVPQADDLNKVIDLATFLSNNPSDKQSIAEHFEFDERQGDYYGNATRYIGLTGKQGINFVLTPLGEKIISEANRKSRNRYLIEALLSTKLFNDLTKAYIHQKDSFGDQKIIERLSQENIAKSTLERRKSTVKSWLNWIEKTESE